MRNNNEIIGINFYIFRKYLRVRISEIVSATGKSRDIIRFFERGKKKRFDLEVATKYFNFICELPGFPTGLKFEDFLSKDLSEYFDKEHSKITTDNFSIEEVSEDVGVDINSDTSTVPASIVNTLPAGLQEFLNDEWEMAAVNPTQDEIEILKKIPWNVSKDFCRRAIGDMRRSRSISKRKAAGASGQSSAG